MKVASPVRQWLVPVSIATIAVSLLGLGGCYERVVSVNGPGGNSVRTQEPYQGDWWIDKQIFGEDRKR